MKLSTGVELEHAETWSSIERRLHYSFIHYFLHGVRDRDFLCFSPSPVLGIRRGFASLDNSVSLIGFSGLCARPCGKSFHRPMITTDIMDAVSHLEAVNITCWLP